MVRTRRLRNTPAIRKLVRETYITPTDLVYPLFVVEGNGIKEPIESMPGIYRYSIDKLAPIINKIVESKISGILIFGIPAEKDKFGSRAFFPDAITQRAIEKIKKLAPTLLIIADVCICEYTLDGHCGITQDGKILNDASLPLLGKTAVSLARAGADIVAPSDMMDGRVAYIRTQLDENGFLNTPIMAYSAKYASSYYAPFREAADSAPAFGDRKTYQMDFSNKKEALKEITIDIDEGADMVIIKPALAYLDVINEASKLFNVPIATYNVSGEYSMVKAAAINGWVDEKKVVLENLTAMKRAGATIIITYHALDVAKWLEE